MTWPFSGNSSTQYDQHEVAAAGAGGSHRRPPGGGPSGPVGYGPLQAAFAVYLMVCTSCPRTGWSRCWNR